MNTATEYRRIRETYARRRRWLATKGLPFPTIQGRAAVCALRPSTFDRHFGPQSV